ncbi:hypothetical protein G5B47_08485 [Paenibacillus sp. 7124]|uniref:Uncharacterized protein n=1 Tax=Paenibacillus apii TaxID=1850370 RepID=A0A6M1PKF9_9BACL|nr:UPF0158 family protein [Paenibacillus apii]NGM82453.1 hypothetical protein [Paenibacillus apii]
MKELKLSEGQMKELVETYDLYMDGIDFFLNIETGEIVTLNSFDPDDEDKELSEIIDEGFNEVYFRVPSRESHAGYRDMSDFAETVDNEKLRTKLVHVLDGSEKIFRKFKDTLASDEQELERYYQFVEVRNRQRVIQWLESKGFRLEVK